MRPIGAGAHAITLRLGHVPTLKQVSLLGRLTGVGQSIATGLPRLGARMVQAGQQGHHAGLIGGGCILGRGRLLCIGRQRGRRRISRLLLFVFDLGFGLCGLLTLRLGSRCSRLVLARPRRSLVQASLLGLSLRSHGLLTRTGHGLLVQPRICQPTLCGSLLRLICL